LRSRRRCRIKSIEIRSLVHVELDPLLRSRRGPRRSGWAAGPGPSGPGDRVVRLPAGARLGPDEIVAPLGEGGMGEVCSARDPRMGRDEAIRVLPAAFSADPDRLRRFEQEARAAGQLNHPSVTTVFDVGEHDGSP
jgi:serine/threonine protein kinase